MLHTESIVIDHFYIHIYLFHYYKYSAAQVVYQFCVQPVAVFYFSAQARRKELGGGDPFNCGSDFPLLHNTIYIFDMQGHRSIRS